MNWFKNKMGWMVGGSSLLGIVNFLGNLFVALSDGQLDANELHQLLGGASGLQVLILMIVYSAYKKDKGK